MSRITFSANQLTQTWSETMQNEREAMAAKMVGKFVTVDYSGRMGTVIDYTRGGNLKVELSNGVIVSCSVGGVTE